MRNFTTICLLLGISILSNAQDIGIGTATPVSALHTAANANHVMTLENTNALATGIVTGMNLAAGINSVNNIKYTGAIRTIGTSSNEARLGFYTFASGNPNSLIERLTILDNGNVGISNTNPSYTFSVNGTGYFSSYVGIQTAPNSSYSLSVLGTSRFYSDISADGNLTVANGKGIVRGVSATQMKIKRVTVILAGTNLGAGSTIESGFLNFGEDFSAVTVVMGQSFNGTGDWAKVLVVPFDVDVANNRCRFTVTNVSSSAITFTSSYEVVLIGN